MKLEHPQLDEFEPLLKNIHKIAFTSGEKFLHREGIRSVDMLKEQKHMFKPFIKYCHKGYDIAQKIIVRELIRYHELRILNGEHIREARNKNDKEMIHSLLDLHRIIDNRIIALRRIADAIAFTLIEAKVWVARRFVLHDRIKEIDINAIKENIKEATWLNDRDRLKFALICDITTFIDVGDLLLRDFRKNPPTWEIIELKKGKVNKLLGDILQKGNDALSEKIDEKLEIVAGKYAPQQLIRMRRQRERIENIMEIIRDNKGKEISTGLQLFLSEDELPSERYGVVIAKALEEANDNGFSIHLVDKCLYVIAAKSVSKALHILFHVMNPEQSCAFISRVTDEIRTEYECIQEMSKTPFITDWANHNMYARSIPPFFIYPLDLDNMFDMVFDRLKIILFLDIPRLAELCDASGYKLELCSRKETEETLQKFGRKSTLLYNNRTLKLSNADGNASQLMGGYFHKIFFEVIRPSELLKMHIPWLMDSP